MEGTKKKYLATQKHYNTMNEINIKKYEKIKEIRNKVRDLSFSLGDLVNMLDNKMIDDKAMKIIEEQAWNMVKQINEVSKDYGNKK